MIYDVFIFFLKSTYGIKVIIWRFSTKSKDIGFSAEFEGSNVVAYQRYNSHESEITGHLIAPSDGKAVLIWDNTYSKMLNKQLSYIVKIIEGHDYESAQKVCSLKEKEKQV